MVEIGIERTSMMSEDDDDAAAVWVEVSTTKQQHNEHDDDLKEWEWIWRVRRIDQLYLNCLINHQWRPTDPASVFNEICAKN